MNDLANKVVLVTGAAGTLGRQACLVSAAAGATVVLLDKNRPGLEQVYDDIVAAGSPQPAIYPLDLIDAKEQDFAFLAARVEQEFGRLDALIHLASELAALAPISDLAALQMERSWQLNCLAPQQMTRAFLPLMNRTGNAVIIFTTDSTARHARAFWGAYGIGKVAMEGLARILSDELEGLGRIRVEILEPGPFDSPIYRRAYPGRTAEGLAPASGVAASILDLIKTQRAAAAPNSRTTPNARERATG